MGFRSAEISMTLNDLELP